MFDIFFISKETEVSDEDFAKFRQISKEDESSTEDFARLRTSCPFAKKVKTFADAQRLSTTQMFWVVWPDVMISNSFNFDYRPLGNEKEYVHVWPSAEVDGPPSVCLFPKDKHITPRELEYRFFSGMIKMNSIACYRRHYDIVFISYREAYADSNFNNLCSHPGVKGNVVKRIHGVDGIRQAHIAAAKLATTPMFWVIDADAIIEDDFSFDLSLSEDEYNIVHVWHSKNPINNLVYGYGGVKLLPRAATIETPDDVVDFTSSISSSYKVMAAISNVTAFNTDPLSTWRSAFRECAKLTSRIIPGQHNTETEHRLKVWMHIGGDKPFGEYALAGASAGEWFGKTYKDNKEMLAKINDYDWLTFQFNEHVKMFDTLSFIPPPDPPPPEEDRINWWRDAFKEAANTTDTDRLDELLNRGINEYTRSGASAGIWWGETYRTNVEKMQQLTDDKFLEGEFYWHTEHYPVEKFK